MTTWQRWSFTALAALVTVSGVLYFWMIQLTPTDPFAVVNHPLQPMVQRVHVLAAPPFLILFGMLAGTHVAWKLRARGALLPSGLITLITIVLMVASGYLLEIAIDEWWRRMWSALHVLSGTIFALACAVHLARGCRRARKEQRRP